MHFTSFSSVVKLLLTCSLHIFLLQLATFSPIVDLLFSHSWPPSFLQLIFSSTVYLLTSFFNASNFLLSHSWPLLFCSWPSLLLKFIFFSPADDLLLSWSWLSSYLQLTSCSLALHFLLTCNWPPTHLHFTSFPPIVDLILTCRWLISLQ